MGLVLNYIERTAAGSFQYRRRVPKDILGIIGKTMFKKKLGDSRQEALAAYPRYHGQVEREIAAARQRLTSPADRASTPTTDREAYAAALRHRADLIAAGTNEEALIHEGDSLADSYPQDDWTPLDVPPEERHKINLLRLGPDRYKAPEPTLNDALRLYVKERLGGDQAADQRPVMLAKRVVGAAIEAMGRGDVVLSSITREDARKVRDEMLDRIKATGRGTGEKVSPATVSRELSIIAAVINFAKVEFGLTDAFTNPFNKLPVARIAKGRGVKAADRRHPLPPEVLAEVRRRVLAGPNPSLALIWRLVEGTGARIAEVTGLVAGDVFPDAEFPHIRIEPNEVRSLKTEASRRVVPLVGDALDAAKEALSAAGAAERAGQGDPLFPEYGRPRGSDAASAALMKHIRRVTVDPKHVVHSLRHNMKDRLVVTEASSLDHNLILGHALEGVGDRVYGGETAKLRAATRAMMKALSAGKTTSDSAS